MPLSEQRQVLSEDYFGADWNDDFGWSLFRALKGAAKTVTSAAKVVRPYIVGGAVVATAIFPPAAPVFAGAAAATASVAALDKKDPKKREKAKRLIVNTKRAAKAGNKGAARAMTYMTLVFKARERAKRAGSPVAWVVDRRGMLLRVM